MDQDLRLLEQELAREPENAILRERFLRACARAEEPVLREGLEVAAALFEGLAAVAQARPELREKPGPGPAGAAALVDALLRPDPRGDYVELSHWSFGADAIGLELLRERLLAPGRAGLVAEYPGRERARPAPESVFATLEPSLVDLLALVCGRTSEAAAWFSWADTVLEGLSGLINQCFEDGQYLWSYRLERLEEAGEAEAAGAVEAVPRLFPRVAGGGTGWGGIVEAPGAETEGPMSPFLWRLFRRALGPGWVMRPTDREVPATYYDYKSIEAGGLWYGFETFYD